MKTTFSANEYSRYVRKAAETKQGLESLEISHESSQARPMAGNSGTAPGPGPQPGCGAVPIDRDSISSTAE